MALPTPFFAAGTERSITLGAIPNLARCGQLLDELKGVAIACIVLYHCAGVFSEQPNGFLFGRFGVDLFLILSGAGLAYFGRPSPPGAFLRRRLWRIAPAYWLAYTGYLVAARFLLHVRYPADNIVIHYLGLQSAFAFTAFDVAPAFWFISLLVYLYPIYAFTTRWHGRIDLMILTGGVATVAAGAWFRWVIPDAVLTTYVTYRVPSFFLGIVVGQFLRHGRMTFRPSWWQGIVLAFVALRWNQYTLEADSMLYGVAIAVCYLLAVRPASAAVGLAAVPRVLGFLGRRSLEIFVLHQPLLVPYTRMALRSLLGVGNPTTAQLGLGAAAAVAVGLLLAQLLHLALAGIQAPRPSGA